MKEINDVTRAQKLLDNYRFGLSNASETVEEISNALFKGTAYENDSNVERVIWRDPELNRDDAQMLVNLYNRIKEVNARHG